MWPIALHLEHVMAPLQNGRNDALTPQGESEWTARRMEPMGHGEKEV